MSISIDSGKLLRKQHFGKTLVLTPAADLQEFEFEQIEAAAEDTLRGIGNGEVQNVVIDFHQTDSYGSTALAFFVKLWKRVKSAGGNLAFCNVSAHEKEILEVTHLSTLWPICDSLEKAFEVVQGKPAE